ncbi:Hypothetical protein PHPALM_8964 [Phytophthora palmivora]|uniref:Uncharacterized protein n=1 Tax=Phytophthora palmivora TaxID=4796 RepID=A0A2P4Y8I5_9STRA|nr:Hypothetical protein PHPALM_8964 [Phytophthora palmivora]
MDMLDLIHHANVQAVTTHWSALAAQFNIDFQPTDINQVDNVDYNHVQFWSQLSLKAKFSLPMQYEFFAVKQAMTLDQTKIYTSCGDYHNPISLLPSTHGTTSSDMVWFPGYNRKIWRHLCKSQIGGRYLIVHAQLLDHWPEIFTSPLAVVDKPGAHEDDIRLINYCSFPPGHSVNDYTDRGDHPPISYNPLKDIARRIHQLKTLNPAASIHHRKTSHGVFISLKR